MFDSKYRVFSVKGKKYYTVFKRKRLVTSDFRQMDLFSSSFSGKVILTKIFKHEKTS